MLDHLTLHVKDIDRSITFYKQALAPLGYIVKAHHEPTLGFLSLIHISEPTRH